MARRGDVTSNVMTAQPVQNENGPTSAEIFWQHPPGPSDRTLIVGTTGSGKTQYALWLLSYQDFDRRPWVIVDYKREGAFAKLRRMKAFRGILKPTSSPPTKPGLYLLPVLETDDEALDAFLWKVWRKGRVGLYFDEGMMVPGGKDSAVRSILIQGRSKHIPVIVNNQTPLNIDTYFKSQASFIAQFWLIDAKDRQEMRRFMPTDPDGDFPQHQAWWWDCSRRVLVLLPKCSEEGKILDRIAARAPRPLFSWWG